MSSGMTPGEAEIQLRVLGAQYGRYIVGHMGVLAQLVRIVNVTSRATDDVCVHVWLIRHVKSVLTASAQQHKERVRLGKEPPLSGIEGRVIRLCGSHSPMTQVSLMRMGEHIMPVYEQPPKVMFRALKHTRDSSQTLT